MESNVPDAAESHQKKRCSWAYPNCKGCHRIGNLFPLGEKHQNTLGYTDLIWLAAHFVFFCDWLPCVYPVQWWLASRVYSRGGTRPSRVTVVAVQDERDNSRKSWRQSPCQVLGTSGHMRMSLWTALPAGKESKLSIPFYLHLLTLTNDIYGSIAPCFIASNTNFLSES